MCKHVNNCNNGQVQGSVVENGTGNGLMNSSGRLPKRCHVKSSELNGQELAKWTSQGNRDQTENYANM